MLHALRDRLSVDEAAALSAQLPMLVRGLFFEGWHPAGKPLKERKRADFLSHIRQTYRQDLDVDVAKITRAVFRVLAKHVSDGEMQCIKATLPTELRELWP